MTKKKKNTCMLHNLPHNASQCLDMTLRASAMKSTKSMPKKLQARLASTRDQLSRALTAMEQTLNQCEEWVSDNNGDRYDDGIAHLWHIKQQVDEHRDDVAQTIDNMLEG